MNSLYTKFLLLIFISQFSYAGIIGSAFGVVKDKAVDKAKDTAIHVYKERKKIRNSNEEKIGQKSSLSKVEDKIDSMKNSAKENVKKVIGKKTIEDLEKEKKNILNKLIGKPTN